MLDEQLKNRIRNHPNELKDLVNPSEEVMIYAVEMAWNNLKYFPQAGSEVRKKALESKGWAIQFMANPTKAEQLLAVSRDADAIQYIKEPDCEVQLAAVTSSWRAIRYIQEPCLEASRLAVRQDEQAIAYLSNLGPEELPLFIKDNLKVLKYVYDSLEESDLEEILRSIFQGEPSAMSLAQFMDLAILDMDKLKFLDLEGSKTSRQLAMDYVLGR